MRLDFTPDLIAGQRAATEPFFVRKIRGTTKSYGTVLITIRILASFAKAIGIQDQTGSEAVETEAGIDRIRLVHPPAASRRWSAVALAAAIVSGNSNHHSP